MHLSLLQIHRINLHPSTKSLQSVLVVISLFLVEKWTIDPTHVRFCAELPIPEARAFCRAFLTDVIRGAMTHAVNAGRDTVTPMDVQYALLQQGHTQHGFGG